MSDVSVHGCDKCWCRSCLYWWSDRCPYGGCYDDLRAVEKPYDKAHPSEPPRKGWTNWKEDQAYWCRGGATYPQQRCPHYAKYKGSTVKSCLFSNVQIFQDGYIQCSIIDNIGCEECYRMFEKKEEE